MNTSCCAGTSGATPLWAGFIALANQLSAQNGLEPLGFINPAIYAIGQSADYSNTFNDILSGTTPSNHPPYPAGEPTYSAGPGYDLTTGWGSPKCGLIDKLATPPGGCINKFWIPDCDNDGYGDSKATPIYSCTAPTGTPTCPWGFSGTYVNVSGDCCDRDVNVKLGQNQYFTTRSACDSFDYNCDGREAPKSNGPTNCYGAGACVPNTAGTACEWTGLPAECNGHATSYNTTACGWQWTLDTNICLNGGGRCMTVGNGGPGGTQECN
jgi:hypothetical protein